jgi:hypothetical protein
MNSSQLVTASLACFVHCALTACGSDSTASPSGGWKGEQPHLSIQGFLNGEDVAVSMDGEGLADGTTVYCERKYQAPDLDGAADLAHATQTEVTIIGTATVAGQMRNFELELMGHALQYDKPGTKLTIVPRVDDVMPKAREMWLEMEWSTLDGEDLLESAAHDGSFTLELFSGEPGEGGVVIPEGEGHVGGYAEARWSVDEKLKISFSSICMTNDVEEI